MFASSEHVRPPAPRGGRPVRRHPNLRPKVHDGQRMERMLQDRDIKNAFPNPRQDPATIGLLIADLEARPVVDPVLGRL
jgi:hypothetical protein